MSTKQRVAALIAAVLLAASCSSSADTATTTPAADKTTTTLAPLDARLRCSQLADNARESLSELLDSADPLFEPGASSTEATLRPVQANLQQARSAQALFVDTCIEINPSCAERVERYNEFLDQGIGLVETQVDKVQGKPVPPPQLLQVEAIPFVCPRD